jgi:hypothetical protein
MGTEAMTYTDAMTWINRLWAAAALPLFVALGFLLAATVGRCPSASLSGMDGGYPACVLSRYDACSSGSLSIHKPDECRQSAVAVCTEAFGSTPKVLLP